MVKRWKNIKPSESMEKKRGGLSKTRGVADHAKGKGGSGEESRI